MHYINYVSTSFILNKEKSYKLVWELIIASTPQHEESVSTWIPNRWDRFSQRKASTGEMRPGRRGGNIDAGAAVVSIVTSMIDGLPGSLGELLWRKNKRSGILTNAMKKSMLARHSLLIATSDCLCYLFITLDGLNPTETNHDHNQPDF